MRLGPLDAIEIPNPDSGAITVLALHGYGANMKDLLPVALELKVRRPLSWLFPDGVEALEWGGKAWFAIDAAALEEAQRTGSPRDLSKAEPEGMAAARRGLQALLQELGRPWPSLALLGFSQGAMLALDLALRAPEAPAGVVLLSGTLVDEAALAALAPRRKGLRFFQSHGSVDPLLGFPQALALEKALLAAGWTGRLRRFEGGHAIPPEVLEGLAAWLESL